MKKLNGRTGIEVLRCAQALDADGMVSMKNRMNRLMNKNRKKVVFDLSRTSSADLAGLGILVERVRALRSVKGDIKFCNVRPELNETLQLVGLNGLIESYPSCEAAINSF